jgi:glycerol-3-phosphate acyltransferase PlsY
MTLQIWSLLLGAYLLGSIPTSFLAVRFMTGQDIRQLGDGNPGAKNTFLSVGKGLGLLAAGIDIAKGWLVVTFVRTLGWEEGLILLAGALVILGHDFSVFLNFGGGQGMAATVGVFAALYPLVTLLAFLLFLITLALSRNWDLCCAAGFILLVGAVWFVEVSLLQRLFPLLMLPWIALRKAIQTRESHHYAI